MAVSVLSAAKTLGELTDWRLSNLELNKVLYLAHMIRLGETNGHDGLITNVFEAWDYGPVSPRLYHKAKIFGSRPVGNIFRQYPSMNDADALQSLSEAVEATEDFSPGRLVAITHWDGGAWYENYQPGVKGVVIPNEDILNEYYRRAGRHEAA